MYKDIAGYDMENGEFEEMCRRTWSEKFNYLCIELSKNRNEVNIVLSMKAKTHILNVFVKMNLFHYHKCCWHLIIKNS